MPFFKWVSDLEVGFLFWTNMIVSMSPQSISPLGGLVYCIWLVAFVLSGNVDAARSKFPSGVVDLFNFSKGDSLLFSSLRNLVITVLDANVMCIPSVYLVALFCFNRFQGNT